MSATENDEDSAESNNNLQNKKREQKICQVCLDSIQVEE
jgi:hypothetical protein